MIACVFMYLYYCELFMCLLRLYRDRLLRLYFKNKSTRSSSRPISLVALPVFEEAPRREYMVNVCNTHGSRPGLIHPAMRARMAVMAVRDERLRPINSVLWNDPMSFDGTLPNKSRGTGFLFGADVARRFLEKDNLGLILRSHEQVLGGFEWPFGRGELLATVFSASNYAGKTLNKGAYALLTASGDAPPPAHVETLPQPPQRHESGGSIRPSAGSRASDGSRASAGADLGRADLGRADLAGADQRGKACMETSDEILADISAEISAEVSVETKKWLEEASGEQTAELTQGSLSHFPFGTLRFISFDAAEIPRLRVQQRNQYRLHTLIFSNRAHLLDAYRAEDCTNSGRLPLLRWAATTESMLQLPFSIDGMRELLLADVSSQVHTPLFALVTLPHFFPLSHPILSFRRTCSPC